MYNCMTVPVKCISDCKKISLLKFMEQLTNRRIYDCLLKTANSSIKTSNE